MCYLCNENYVEPKYDEKSRPIIEGVTWWDGQGVNASELREQIVRLAEDNPLEERACFYSTSDGEGSYTSCCIVGQGVYELTGKVVYNEEWNGTVERVEWAKALGVAVNEKQEGYVSLEKFSNYGQHVRDMKFVRAVQKKQDSGWPWGAAVRWARWREREDGGFQASDF